MPVSQATPRKIKRTKPTYMPIAETLIRAARIPSDTTCAGGNDSIFEMGKVEIHNDVHRR